MPAATPAPSAATPAVLTARALLLDMDGTLVNSDAVVERIWRSWAERHGLDGDEVMEVVHGRQGHASMAVLLPDRPMERNLADNARMLAEETADMDGVVEIPGATAFLASLRGLPHALVTSADAPWPPPAWPPPVSRCPRCASRPRPSARASPTPRGS